MKNKKIFLLLFGCQLLSITGCSKQDPILPGARSSIFETNNIVVENTQIPENLLNAIDTNSLSIELNKFSQDTNNTIWENLSDGSRRKIFSGFATDNCVSGVRTPVSVGNFVYAGLTTGEVVKVNLKSREMVWVADVFAESNMTGGASVLDIVAPIIVSKGRVFAGGLGGQICSLRDKDGRKNWCLPISVDKTFVMHGEIIVLKSIDNNLYAIDAGIGKIYWRAKVKKNLPPQVSDGVITVGREQFDLRSGQIK